MKFDKSKVYTTFNCDEVKIGSKGYFADCKEDLITRVQFETKAYYDTFDKISTHTNDFVFVTPQGGIYRYFHLVEEPKEPTKRPCTREELIEMLKKQGLPILKRNLSGINYMVEAIAANYCFMFDRQNYVYQELCERYTLLDGTELWVEE